MAKRIQLGDIIEIPVKEGFAYAQYVNSHEKRRSLLLVFPKIYGASIIDFSLLYSGDNYYVWFPLGPAIHRGIFKVVAHQMVPEFATKLPVFKIVHYDKNGAVYDNWWLWDGKKEWWIGDLPKEMESYPDGSIINDTLLIERIEEGWRPSKRGW